VNKRKKAVIAVSGASGAGLGIKAARLLPASWEKHIIFTDNARTVLEKEAGLTLHDDGDIAAPTASGSFAADVMLIAPCSMNTLAKIACGIADNLTTRSAAVMIKERKTLILAPRELPFSPIALENMHKLSTYGVIIAPPVMGYYAQTTTLEAMEDFIIGKWFDLMGIDNELYTRWEG
jgi:4-hydroxy-3-polyprenylbenzoate decarboxylase